MKKINKIVMKIALVIFISSITIACNSQNKKKDLGSILKDCKMNLSDECKKTFFDNFPNNYNEFQKLYGYDDVKGEAPYYSNSEEHLTFFFQSSDVIKKVIFIEKLFNICKNGKWDADSVNSFQDKMRTFFFSNSDLFLELLKNKSESEVKGFWYFFSDEPHFNKNISDKVLKLLEKDNGMKVRYLEIVQKVKEDNKH